MANRSPSLTLAQPPELQAGGIQRADSRGRTANVPGTQTAANTAPPASPLRITKPVYAGTALVADPALIEQTAAGPLPRIADDGRTPMQAYAPPVAPTAKPRIAIW